ncbi:MAG: hypothetical protein SGI92_28845 [Bryobacteraceae bacterium]|nr:hypothetical protein [Bryobacteraceae bacterium]
MSNGVEACFVVMPFGKKLIPDGTARMYDFDKVYRVLIQRAVKQAGLKPIRADERTGSALIHSEMFKDLRDQAVVLADLSLDNPNVFYELGIRHVMSPAGTVLICRKGSELPFDVKLSRVIFYEYDGAALDWEEVERVVNQVQIALEDARKGRPDSPVHALLESVLRRAETLEPGIHVSPPRSLLPADSLEEYQTTIARDWVANKEPLESLTKQYRDRDVFGARCLGYFCLHHPGGLPVGTEDIARHLADAEQYGLANRLFDELRSAGLLSTRGLLSYATSFSEVNGNLAGASASLELVQEALSRTASQYPDPHGSPAATLAYALCHRRTAGLRHWRWQLSRLPQDLDSAIEAHVIATTFIEECRAAGTFDHPGFLAQSHLKLMLLLRFRENDPERPDSERHRESILSIHAMPGDERSGISYLNWFQVIALADAGSAQQSQQRAVSTLATDAQLRNEANYWDIGRRQYRTMRRFLEQNSRMWRNRSLIGTVAQLLQSGEGT